MSELNELITKAARNAAREIVESVDDEIGHLLTDGERLDVDAVCEVIYRHCENAFGEQLQ
jgi:hypothetical protein